MTILKWTWKIIWRCLIIPVIVTAIVMIVSLLFINDTNQNVETGEAYSQNYGTSYHHNQEYANENPSFTSKYNQYDRLDDKRYHREIANMKDSDFDLASIISMIALFGTFILMVIYTIIDIRDDRKQQKDLRKL